MIKDSGERREFKTGAVRDIQKGKGRCDLLPLDVASWICDDDILFRLHLFARSKDINYIKNAIDMFVIKNFNSKLESALLEVAVHYEEGATKYGEHNWQKGIPTHCYLDSAVRHYLKWQRGDTDERHDRAFIWNLLGLAWTMMNKPDLDDIKTIEGDDEDE